MQNNGVITLSIQRHGATALFRSQTSFLHLGQPHTAASLAVHRDFVQAEQHYFFNFSFFCFQNEHFLGKHMLSQGIFIYKSPVLKTLKHTSTLCNKWLMS